MKKRICRAASLLLSAALLASSLAACADTPETPGETVTEAGTEAETRSVYDLLEKADWEGRTFSILCRQDSWNNHMSNFLVEEYGAEGNTLLDDSIYERNQVVSHDLNIVIAPYYGGDYNAVNATVASQSASGTDDYDAMVGHLYTYTSCAVNKSLWNLAAIPTLDLGAVWWDQQCSTNLSAYGYVPLGCGDILPNSLTMTSAQMFNKKIMTDLGIEMPYDAVRQGKWTLEKLTQITADVTTDKNGDGKLNPKDDLFGISAYAIAIDYALLYGCGIKYIAIGEDGVPAVEFDHEKVIDVYEKIYHCLITQDSYYVTTGVDDQNEDMFIDGHAMFLDGQLATMSLCSASMADDYGVLPEPKYDELQEDYLSFVNGDTPLMGVIASEKTPEFSGAVLDAMGAYNHAHITPLLFEIVTKYRNARDPESAEMVDVIIRNRVFDFAYFYALDLGFFVVNSLNAGKTSIAGSMTTSEKTTKNQLKNAVKRMKKE